MIMTVLVLLLLLFATATGGGSIVETVSQTAPACVPTLPDGSTPPDERPSPLHHGDGALFTVLGPDGVVVADSVAPDGSVAVKFPWWRAPGVGAADDLVITGREVEREAMVTSETPGGYDQPFQASAIRFPGEGCYEITARSGDASLTFVVEVRVS